MNYIEYVLFGKKQGEKYDEVLAEKIPTLKQAEEIKEKAEKIGFICYISKIDLSEKPSFIKTLSI